MSKTYLEKNNHLRTPCEQFSRVMGYIRPVSGWNDGKQQEFADRKMFEVPADTGCSCKEHGN